MRSRALSSIGYDPDAQVLEVEFRTGKIYRYLGVPAELHAWLMRSPGKGGLFNRLVEGKFEFQRVIDPPDAAAPSLEDALKASLAGAEEKEPEGSA